MKTSLPLIASAMMLTLPVIAQERAAAGPMDTQMTWSALSGQISAMGTKVDAANKRMDQFVLCGRKGMLYAPGHLNASGVADADADGCLTAGGSGAAPTDYCYARYAERFTTPHCDKDYYVKATDKATDDNWDGYNAICCYSKPGKDPRVEADKAGFIAQSNAAGGNKVRVAAASVGLPYNAIVAACAAKPSTYANHQATCPPADVLP